MGGDEVRHLCWIKRFSIFLFMVKHKIFSYSSLHSYFRERISKFLDPNKRKIFWANTKKSTQLHLESNDIVQYWGKSKNIHILNKIKN